MREKKPKRVRASTQPDGHARRQASKRAEILAAAKEVFFRKGYARTSMDDIQQAVGGSKRTLYRHFPAKEDLYEDIIRDVAERIIPASDAEFTKDILVDLRMLGTRYLSTLLMPETIELYRGVIAEAPHLPGLAEIFFSNGPGRLMENLKHRFELENEQGRWKVSDPWTAAQHFVGLLRTSLHGPALIMRRTVPQPEIDRCVEDAINTLVHGVFLGKRPVDAQAKRR